MRALVLCPTTNRPGRHDASGAFIPKAREFCRLHGLPRPTSYNNPESDAAQGSAADRRLENEVLALIAAAPRPLELFAYFGHGLDDGLNSLGFRGQTDAGQLCEALRTAGGNTMTILLYACSAANGFASWMASGVPGSRVYAHTNARHTTQNPYMKVFPGDRFVVEPNSARWDNWARGLRETSLWAVFPWLTDEQLTEVLALPTAEVDAFLQVGTRATGRATQR